MKNYKVSICIPIFNSEDFLEECLESIAVQDFSSYEIIAVNDGSEGKGSEEIIKKFKKKYKLPITYIVHETNKGLLEARRTAIYEAHGDYIFNLDSDDKLLPHCIQTLYNVAINEDADIVQGKAVLFDRGDNYLPPTLEEKVQIARKNKIDKITNVFNGTLEGKDILKSYLVDNTHSGFLWGKLIKKDIYLEALNKIPPMFCTMAEDIIQYIWLAVFSKKYVGVDDKVYQYCNDTGITSNRVINSLSKWEQVCSVSSIFTSIYTSIENHEIELSKEEREKIAKLCVYYVGNNLDQLKGAVISELKEEAYNILCEYWGEEFVATVEKERYKKDKK